MRGYRLRVLGTALLAALAIPGHAAERQSLEAVREAVERFVRADSSGEGRITGVRVDRLDPRLRLTACQGPLETWRPQGHAGDTRLSVGVRCNEPKRWKLYVPVRVNRELEVVVTTRPLSRGQTVGRDHVELKAVSTSRLRNHYYTRIEELVGQEAASAARSGEILTAADLVAPRLVRRGQSLLIEAGAGTVTVKMRGKALEDGRSGELVQVRNHSSNRVVQGRVVGRDRVRVVF